MMSEVPEYLKQFPQFIIYRRSDKVPFDFRTGKPANPHDPATWTDVANATAIAASWGLQWGVGFALNEGACLAVVDVDGCRNSETGELTVLAQALIAMLPGAYVEVSISGRGIHIWFRYSGGMPAHASRAAGIGEVYHKDRYIAIGAPYRTSGFTNGDVGADLTAKLPGLISMFFAAPSQASSDQEWTEGPCEGWNGPSEDSELIQRAMNSRSTASAF